MGPALPAGDTPGVQSPPQATQVPLPGSRNPLHRAAAWPPRTGHERILYVWGNFPPISFVVLISREMLRGAQSFILLLLRWPVPEGCRLSLRPRSAHAGGVSLRILLSEPRVPASAPGSRVCVSLWAHQLRGEASVVLRPVQQSWLLCGSPVVPVVPLNLLVRLGVIFKPHFLRFGGSSWIRGIFSDLGHFLRFGTFSQIWGFFSDSGVFSDSGISSGEQLLLFLCGPASSPTNLALRVPGAL